MTPTLVRPGLVCCAVTLCIALSERFSEAVSEVARSVSKGRKRHESWSLADASGYKGR